MQKLGNYMDTTIDPTIKNLVSAIGKAETGKSSTQAYTQSGKSGEFGRFQFMPETWKQWAPEAGVDVKDTSITAQNKVAYNKVKEWKDKGMTPAMIASKWNSGDENKYKQNWKGVNKEGVAYDTPAYTKKVSDYYNELKGQTTQTSIPDVAQPTQQDNGITGNETAGQAGMNALANTIPSAVNFGKGVVKSFNPVNTLNTIGEVGNSFNQGSKEMGAGNLITETIKGLPKAAYETLVPKGIRQAISGDTQGASKTFQEDPFGTVAPVVLAGVGGVKGLAKGEGAKNSASMKGYVDNIGENVKNKVPIPEMKNTYQNINNAVDTGISKTAGLITKPFEYVGGKISNGLGKLTTSTISQLSTLPESGIVQAFKDPNTMSKIEMENNSRGGLAGEVKTAIDTRLKDLTETGQGYDAIRNSTQTIQAPNFMADVLSKNGFKLKNGKILADTNSTTRNTADIGALQKFYDNWGNKTTFTPNEFLNMRGDIAELAKFDKVTGMGKTSASSAISKDIYSKANETMRDPQLQELKALDETYAPEVKFLKQAKKDYFNPDGTLKDGAGNKIANAGNKVELLKRLENIMPGITKRIELLKVVEDMEHAQGGFKVGGYTRGALTGGAILTGNLPAILAAIITSPSMALKIIRAAGYTAQTIAPVINALKIIVGKTNNLEVPTKAGLLNNPISRQDLQSKIPGLFQGNIKG